MAFCKLLASPLPHARVTGVDASAALAMPGVYGVLTADDVPTFPAPQDAILTNEPVFVGQPILAVAAESEALAADALEKIKVTYEELPFTVDPLASLFPEGAEARTNGNVANRGVDLKSHKWAARDFAAAAEGQLPTGAPVTEWSYGDVDQGLKGAKLVLDESFVTAGLSHHCSSRVARSRTGRTASACCTRRRRASASRCLASRGISASRPTISYSSPSSAAAVSGRKAAPIRSWRCRHISRKRSAGR